jgi:sorting nexin-29
MAINYRGSTLSSVAYKILSGVLCESLKEYVENTFGEYQCGFRPYRIKIDQTFFIRKMLEIFYEHGIIIHILFIHFKQAFDGIRRDELYEVVLRGAVQVKVIKLVPMAMHNTSAKVKVGITLSESLQFKAGVKQEDGLSTTLFKIALYGVINKIDQKGTIFLKSSQICAYENDLVIVTGDVNTLKLVHWGLEREIRNFGLSVNEKKV